MFVQVLDVACFQLNFFLLFGQVLDFSGNNLSGLSPSLIPITGPHGLAQGLLCEIVRTVHVFFQKVEKKGF